MAGELLADLVVEGKVLSSDQLQQFARPQIVDTQYPLGRDGSPIQEPCLSFAATRPLQALGPSST